MRFLVSLFALAAAFGLAAKWHLFDGIHTDAHKAVIETGMTSEQADTLLDIRYWLSINNILEAVGYLPPPFGSICQVLVILMLIALVVLVIMTALAAVFRGLRWFKDLTL